MMKHIQHGLLPLLLLLTISTLAYSKTKPRKPKPIKSTHLFALVANEFRLQYGCGAYVTKTFTKGSQTYYVVPVRKCSGKVFKTPGIFASNELILMR